MALTPNSVRSSDTILASSCLLTRPIAAMSARHISIDIDGAAADSVPGGHIQTGFLKKTRPWIDPIPGSDALLGVGDIPSHLGVEGGGEVSKGVVPRHARASALAFFGVVASRVKHVPTDFPALLPVLTHSPFGTNR